MFSNRQLARICYMLQFEIQLAREDPLPHWDELPDWLQDIWISGVRMARLGHGIDQVHNNFRDRMREAGWVYGPRRDKERKTHPLLLPLHELDKLDRAKVELIQQTIVMLTLTLPPSLLTA